MLEWKAFIVELVAVDRSAARALHYDQAIINNPQHQLHPEVSNSNTASTGEIVHLTQYREGTYITPGEIATLKHEPRNNPMEAATLITKPFLLRAKGSEVLGSCWYDAVEIEDDSSWWACAGQGVRAEMDWLRGHGLKAALPLAMVISK